MNKEDLKYEYGFPANIDTKENIVVQILKKEQSLILYTCKITGNYDRCYLPCSINKQFEDGLYFL